MIIEIPKKYRRAKIFDETNLTHVLMALSLEYVDHAVKKDRCSDEERNRLEEISRYVGHQFASLSDEEYDNYSMIFNCFFHIRSSHLSEIKLVKHPTK